MCSSDLVDLGSHGGESLPPFGLNARSCDLAIIHVHNRCIDLEVKNSRQAVVRHKYIAEDDSEKEAISKINALDYNYMNVCNKTSSWTDPPPILSWHKVLFYASFLQCPNETTANFYANVSGRLNTLFAKFIHQAFTMYDTKHIQGEDRKSVV